MEIKQMEIKQITEEVKIPKKVCHSQFHIEDFLIFGECPNCKRSKITTYE